MNFLLEILLKLASELLREKEKEFSILKAFVLQKKIEILIHHLQLEKFHLAKVLKERLHYIVQ